jgi:hypothetical protein
VLFVVVTAYAIGESLEIGVITSDGNVVPSVHESVRVVPSETVKVAAGALTWSVTGTTKSRSPETPKCTLAV